MTCWKGRGKKGKRIDFVLQIFFLFFFFFGEEREHGRSEKRKSGKVRANVTGNMKGNVGQGDVVGRLTSTLCVMLETTTFLPTSQKTSNSTSPRPTLSQHHAQHSSKRCLSQRCPQTFLEFVVFFFFFFFFFFFLFLFFFQNFLPPSTWIFLLNTALMKTVDLGLQCSPL